MPRLIYYGGQGNRRPSGGLQTLLQHARWLREDGFDTYLHAGSAFSSGNYDMSGIRILPDSDAIGEQDYVIYPEPDLRPVTKALKCRKWIFCQNHYYVHNTQSELGDWQGIGIQGVLTSSGTILNYVRQHYPGLRVELIPYSIDQSLFRDVQPKRLQIAYMPRKRGIEAKYIRGTFGRRFPELSAVEWVEIDAVGPSAVAKFLSESAIFLALGRLEGFGLPPIEAMCCGALVVGFSGGGADEYAHEHTGLWSRPDDFDSIINNLGLAVLMIRGAFTGVQSYRRAGFRVAHAHTEDRARAALRTAWNRILQSDVRAC